MAGNRVHTPEVLGREETLPPDLMALRRFARLLDEAIPIPGTKRRVGLDAGLGLIPGVGDVVSGLMSSWIIMGALRHRVPTRKVMRMVVNVLVDLAVGAFPLLGDFFDFMFEQNVMNMRLLMEHRNTSLPPRSTAEIMAAATLVVIIIVGFALCMLGVTVALVIWIARLRLS